MKKLVFTLVLVVLFPAAVRADVGPPAQLQITEQEQGRYTVQWRVPKVLPPRALPIPQLPQGFDPVGDVSITSQQAAWLFTQEWRSESSLAGQLVGLKYPFPDLSLTTVVRVNLLSGDRFAHVLSVGEESWQLPMGTSATDPIGSAQRAVLAGVVHDAGSWIHLLFLVVLVLLGNVCRSLRIVAVFTMAQVLAVLVMAALRFYPEHFPLELGFALSVALLSRQLLLPQEGRRGLVALAAVAGLLHGAGMGSLLTETLGAVGSGTGIQLAAVLGVDAVHIVGMVLLGWIWRALVRGRKALRLGKALAYGAGGIAVAMAIAFALPQSTPAIDANASGLLNAEQQPSAAAPNAAAVGSQRISPRVPDAPIQSLLTVEPFEVRHEVMLRLAGLARALGLTENSVIEISEQTALTDRLVALVVESTKLQADGRAIAAQLRRVDFMSVDPTGALPRANPVPEPLAEAVIGVIVAYPMKGMPRTVELTWAELPGSVAAIPATVIDPETVGTQELSSAVPTLTWENNLFEDPIPTVSSVTVEPSRVSVPWLSLPLFCLAVVLVGMSARRQRSVMLGAARVMLALALIVGPLLQSAVAIPGSAGRTPSERQASRILSGLLPNVYGALEYREESAVYDRLSHSLTGETLTQVYLELRRGLELEERGGAQARVEAVEVLEASDIESRDNGFMVTATWNVGGMVTHFGHRHFRQNKYNARLGITPVEGSWKIQSLQVLELERVR